MKIWIWERKEKKDIWWWRKKLIKNGKNEGKNIYKIWWKWINWLKYGYYDVVKKN